MQTPTRQIHANAILFDFDGILIDSEPVYELHWRRWAEGHGVSVSHIMSVHHGIPPVQTIGIVAPHLDAVHEAEQFKALCVGGLDGLIAHDGVAALLPTLPRHLWAIATSSFRKMVLSQLAYLGLPKPDVLVTYDDVVHGKPAPEPYQKAAMQLGFAPEDCVVIEDSLAGIKAGKAAGAQVIAVATTNTKAALGEADVVVERFADLAFVIDGDRVTVNCKT
ncbi:MAG: HAD-IA family hydrolase [Bacteroidota bacterium]